MSLPLAILIVVCAGAAAALVFGVIQRTAHGPLLLDSGRGRGMIQVVGTSFAVLLAFVILAAYQTYSGAKAAAGSEATAVLDMARTAALFPAPQRDQLRGDLVCYGRAVIGEEWPAMRHARSSPVVDQWIDSYRTLFAVLDLHTTREQLALQELLTLATTRTAGRQQRLNDDTPAIPTPLWLALIFGGFVAIALQISVVDPRERLRVLCPMIGGVAGVVAAGLLVVYFLDHPYQSTIGGIQPSAMRQTLTMVPELGPSSPPPCNESGQPV
jgi:Protein of unknown function (DUF4239)